MREYWVLWIKRSSERTPITERVTERAKQTDQQMQLHQKLIRAGDNEPKPKFGIVEARQLRENREFSRLLSEKQRNCRKMTLFSLVLRKLGEL